MYSNVSIRNFRCFKEVKFEGLKRISLVTGKNDVGKTSCLEAIFLLIGGFNPALPFTINALRGVESLSPNAQEQWGWLFYNRDTTQVIEILGTMPGRGGEDLLRVHLGTQKQFEVLSKGEQELNVNISGTRGGVGSDATIPSSSIAVQPRDLILEFTEHQGRFLTSRAAVGPDGKITIEQPQQNQFRPGAFLATRVRTASEDANRFSQLKVSKRDHEVVDSLRTVEPKVRDLTILVQGGHSVIHADMEGIGLVPMPMLGEGIGRLLSLTLAILTTPGGIVLVDEIENGLHHSVLSKVWKGLGFAAAQTDTQLIATTHSGECLAAAHRAFSASRDYDFSVIQLFRLPHGIQSRVLYRKQIEAALSGDIDLRS
jgi:hypothetical protein